MLELMCAVCTGTKQSGEALGDVILPPWAKGCPIEFIRLHREVGFVPHPIAAVDIMVMYVCIDYSTQTGQHERCKRECCPVWVLQYICWISIGKWHV